MARSEDPATAGACRLASSSSGNIHLVYNAKVTYPEGAFWDVMYGGEAVPETSTKRYYAGGVQVATRVDDTLVYNLHDPSGMSLVMADVDGNEVGRMLYDGFGGVLTSTVPITLTGAVSNVPDATTGLVYQGGGRWYDPALGRPLQPNAAGGPPTVPQALNRYAATPIGQPGVYQAELSSWNPFTDDNTSNIGKALVGNEVSEAVARGLYSYFRASAYTIIGDPMVNIGIEVVAKSQFAEKAVLAAGFGGMLARDLMPTSLQRFGQRLFYKAIELNSQPIVTKEVIGYNFSYGHRLPAGRLAGKLVSSKLGLHFLDFGIGFGIDVGYQFALDFNNPYLTREQRTIRAGVQGFGSALSFGAGLAIAEFLGPPAWIVTGVGIIVSIAWDAWPAQRLYEFFGAVPERDLMPLQIQGD